MKRSTFSIVILFIILACSPEKETEIQQIQKSQLPVILPVHSKPEYKRTGLHFEYSGIDSLEVVQLIASDHDLMHSLNQLEENSTVQFEKRDLGGNSSEEIFITLDDEYSRLFQQNDQDVYHLIWEGYEEGGNPPELAEYPLQWIKQFHYMPCSNCSEDGVIYYKVYQDSVVEAIEFAWAFNMDYEYGKTIYTMYDQCNATIHERADGFDVTYSLQFSEIETSIIFMKGVVKISYQWDEQLQKITITQINPRAFEPYLQHWLSKPLDHWETRPANRLVLKAYIDYRENTLLALNKNPAFKKVIWRLERSYGESWNHLIKNWPEEHSW